ncbi:MAG: acyl-CoA dehydratase activase [Elusimicrobiota bacterium]
MNKIFLGIDVGSVSTNVAAIDPGGTVLAEEYIRTNGQPIESVKLGLKNVKAKIDTNTDICGVGVTGSGRQLISIMVGADVVKNEITAHAGAAVHYYPDVKTVFEIGGQDSKLIIIRDQMVTDFSMNTVCAAGTGSFLDHQSERLGIPIEQFGDHAVSSSENVRIAGRCTVFAESDMVAKQQFGFTKSDIIKGLCDALVRNYINNLCRGKTLAPPYVFQGGVAANKGIIAAFEKELNSKVIVPEYYGVMGAIGAALLAKSFMQLSKGTSRFRGFDVSNLGFKPGTFECNGCSNMCEVVKVEIQGKPVAMWGDKCMKWTNSVI